MIKRFACYLLCIVLAAAAGFSVFSASLFSHKPVVTFSQPGKPRLRVVLIPLDSRPPCTQFVEELAAIADFEMILPPAELMDNYKKPSDKIALRAWLKNAVAGADAAIVSTDMLIHGGLLASRSALGSAADAAETVAVLEAIHREHPEVKLYGFSIIPRLLIADSNISAQYQKKMLKYSLLKDEILTFDNPVDLAQLEEVEKTVPSEVIKQYIDLNEANQALDQRLIDLADSGVLAGLVLGQDDGQPFGLPNIAKERLASYLQQRPHLADRVFITRGTDEVALTLLGHIATRETKLRPRVQVQYSQPEAAGVVMPFMPHSVGRTVEEKLALAGAVQTDNPEEADFILYVHIGTQKTRSSTLVNAAKEVNRLLAAGKRVALVDLSEDYYAHETLLPYLLKEDAAIDRLIAYGGWNTTSNSIGTAVTQAVLFQTALTEDRTLDHVLRVYKNNLEFLCSRFLDDWYYQKDVQTVVRSELQRLNIDGNNLVGHYQQVNAFVRRQMAERADTLQRQALLRHPLTIESDQGQRKLKVVGMDMDSHLPWQRIFEIWVKPTLLLDVEDAGQ